jgi:hypothetical protein
LAASRPIISPVSRLVFLLAFTGAACLIPVAPLVGVGGLDSGFLDAGLGAHPDSGIDAGSPDGGAPVDAGTSPDAGDGGALCLPDSGVAFSCAVQAPPTLGTGAIHDDLITSSAFATGDLNHDGLADLFKVGWTLGSLSMQELFIYYGLSDGGLLAGPTFSTDGDFVAVGDLNGDGWADFVIDTSIELNKHDGTFARTPLSPTLGLGHSVLIADLDGNGHPDLIYCTNAGVEAYFDHDGAFGILDSPTLVEPDACEGLVVADFNQGGLPDLAETQLVFLGPPSNETVLVRFGLGEGAFSEAARYSLSQPGHDIQAADLDGDGWPDLIIADSGGVSILQGEGCGFFDAEARLLPAIPTTTTLQRLLVGDLNGDCYSDILVWGSSECDQVAAADVLLFPNAGPRGFQPGTRPETTITRPWGVALWQPGNTALPSLVLGEFCNGNFSTLPDITP